MIEVALATEFQFSWVTFSAACLLKTITTRTAITGAWAKRMAVLAVSRSLMAQAPPHERSPLAKAEGPMDLALGRLAVLDGLLCPPTSTN